MMNDEQNLHLALLIKELHCNRTNVSSKIFEHFINTSTMDKRTVRTSIALQDSPNISEEEFDDLIKKTIEHLNEFMTPDTIIQDIDLGFLYFNGVMNMITFVYLLYPTPFPA